LVKAVAFLMLVGCQARTRTMDSTKLREFATKYTAAWCSQIAASVAAFFAEGGSLKINDGPPSVGRKAITEAPSWRTLFENFPRTKSRDS
jgi:hypothetical protein